MKVKWYGHSAFLITSDQGIKIIIDPYEPGAFGGQLSYGKIIDRADIVLITHEHADHNYSRGLPGTPLIIKGIYSNTIKGIPIKGIPVFHDSSAGKERGANTLFTLEVDHVRFCHLGDLGHLLSDQELGEIGLADILLIPVGGLFTIDPEQAARVAEQIKPKIVIPMHFKTEKCGFSIAPVEDFLKGKTNVRLPGKSEIAFEKSDLPEQMEILVLGHAL